MLVLSRKLGEKIVTPQCGLSVTVMGIQGNRVRLGISAPPDVAVLREEVWHRMCSERADGANAESTPDSLDAMPAELSAAAHQIALRHGLADSWVDLELALWQAFEASIKNWQRNAARPTPRVEFQVPLARHVPLPR